MLRLQQMCINKFDKDTCMHFIHKQQDACQFEFQCLVVLRENVESENAFVSHFQIIIYCDQNGINDIYIVVALNMFL